MESNQTVFGNRQKLGLALGVAAFIGLLVMPPPEGMELKAQRMAAVAALMAIWWITEAIPIAATALIPLALVPLLGVQSSSEAAAGFGNHLVFLYFAGFVLALAMERCNLHRRIALQTIQLVGTSPRRLVLGFLLATAGLSMWVSNTATTLVMLPIAIAVVKQLAPAALVDGETSEEISASVQKHFGSVLLLGLAFSASVGGVGTVIGTGTTVAFLGFLEQRFPDQPPISFLDWSLLGVPIVIVFLPIMWWYLCRYGSPLSLHRLRFSTGAQAIRDELNKMGRMSQAERTVLTVFILTALGWVFRRPIELGTFRIPGWSDLFPAPSAIHDTTIGMAAALLLFCLPERWTAARPSGTRRFLMDWETIQRGIPWGIILLLGGGFALASGIEASGLAPWIGGQLAVLRGTPVWILVPAACLLAVVMTETTSNVATVLMLAPILVEAALELNISPYLLLIPTTIMTSFAFMLPVATPPNAIVFSSGWITIPQMFRVGVILDLIALLVVPVMIYFLGGAVLRFD